MRDKRFRLLRGVSQVDTRSCRMVNQRFPRLAFLEHGIYHAHHFAHVCAKVDVFSFSAPLLIPHLRLPVKPGFLDLLRLLEHVHFENGNLDLESLSAMPSLKSVSFSTWWYLEPHENGHGASYLVQEPLHSDIFSRHHCEAIGKCSPIWEKGVRLFRNRFNKWSLGNWQLTELFLVPATAEKPQAVRVRRFTVGCQHCLDAVPPGILLPRALSEVLKNPYVDDFSQHDSF